MLVRPMIDSWEVPRIARIASGESRRISFISHPRPPAVTSGGAMTTPASDAVMELVSCGASVLVFFRPHRFRRPNRPRLALADLTD